MAQFSSASLVVTAAAAAEVSPAASPAPARNMPAMDMKSVVYQLSGMDKVLVKQDLKYSSGDDPHLLMDVYVPPDLTAKQRRPAVLFIHRGAGAENTPKDWGI